MRFLKANKLFNGQKFLPEGKVLVLNDDLRLEAIISENDIETSNIEKLEGIITPGFVNAHCHLELSHLKNKIPQHTGLPSFAKHVISQRENFSKEEIKACMHDADKTMWDKGIVAVGDISNNADSFLIKQESKLYYHTFIELIGLNPEFSETIYKKGLELLTHLQTLNLAGSLAPHAPYSTSRELITLISEFNATQNTSISIHNQESEEETKFFMNEKSGFDDLYAFLNLNISYFNAPKQSSLKHYIDVLKQTPSILVHNTFTQHEDIIATKTKNVHWCFCPQANLYIENQLPNFSLFENNKEKTCIGTDSLASNTNLDVVAEANTILKYTPIFSTEEILRMITSNSANALGIADNFGELIVGKNSGLNLIEFKNNEFNFIKKLA